jgi:DNA gyrase subunit B
MGLEQVQLRPGMYIGNTEDGSGLDNMVAELVSNALAEAPACDRIAVTLGDAVTVRDNGPGLPTSADEEWDVAIAELLFTQLLASARFTKFDNPSLLMGVGHAVVNALSDEMRVRIWRGGLEYAMSFHQGEFQQRLHCTGAAGNVKGLPRRGTEIAFVPSPRFFATTFYDFERLEQRLREFASSKCGATVTLTDRRCGAPKMVTFGV